MEISKNNESTSYPFWIIIDPAQNFKVDSDGIHNIANMITGVWFSREKAEEFLKRTHYNFSENAKVFCASGAYSEDWVRFHKESENENRFNIILQESQIGHDRFYRPMILAIYDFIDKGGVIYYREDESLYSSAKPIDNVIDVASKLKEGKRVKFELNKDDYAIRFYVTGEVKIEKL